MQVVKVSDRDILKMLDDGELCKPDVCPYRPKGCACTDTAAFIRSQSAENRELRETIIKAYQRLGFTNHKNETMRILGDMIRKVKDSASTLQCSRDD